MFGNVRLNKPLKLKQATPSLFYLLMTPQKLNILEINKLAIRLYIYFMYFFGNVFVHQLQPDLSFKEEGLAKIKSICDFHLGLCF